MDSADLLAGGGSAVVGGIVVVVGRFLIDWNNSRSKNDMDLTKQQSDLISAERKDLLAAQQQLRNELSSQILDLRKQVLDLQELNHKYVAENAALRARLTEIENDNKSLAAEVQRLEDEIAQFRSNTSER